MPVRLIAIDIDGTLLDSRWQLPEANVTAIAEAARRGILVVLATGRRFDFARPVLGRLPAVEIIITSGGAATKTRDGASVARRVLPAHLARRVLAGTTAFRAEMGVVFDRVGPDQLVYERVAWDDPRHRAYFERNRQALAEVAPLEACLTEDPIQIMGAGGVDRMRALAAALAGLPDATRFEVALTEYPARDLSILDVTAAGVSKGSAVADLARARGLPAESVMAIGDNLNDESMLQVAGVPVVMANAPAALMAPGRLSTASNDQSGVAQAILKYALDSG
jgi:hypothetical protein